MVRAQASAGLDVLQIFNLCQKSQAAHTKCAEHLWKIQQKDSEECLQQVYNCLTHVLRIPLGEQSGNRIMRFISSFLQYRDLDRESDCDTFAEKLLRLLVDLVTARDKSARTRCCQLVQLIFNHLTADELDSDLLDTMQEAMLLRLEDKVPAVRAQAVQALRRLCDPGDAGDYADDPVMEAYLQLLAADKSKDVRKAVLFALPACETMVAEIIERTRDVNEEVRRMAFIMLTEKVEASYLSVEQRAELLQHGLGERVQSVKGSALHLLQTWLDEACGKDVIKLLDLLDVESHQDVASQAVAALIEAQAIDPVQMAHEAAEGNKGLRGGSNSPPLSTAEALLWKMICCHLYKAGQESGQTAVALSGAPATVEAATAEGLLKALEAAMPPTVTQFMQLVTAHAQAGQEHSFATCHLLQLAATCVDMTDATGRQAAADMVRHLLQNPSRSNSDSMEWEAALVQLACHVHASHAELADAMLCMLWDMFDGWNLSSTSQADSNTPMDTSGSFDTILHQASAVRGQNEHWVHCLKVVGLLLQQLPSARLRTAGAGQFGCVEDLWPLLIMPGLGHAVAAVRLEAMRTLGMYCLLDGIPRPEGQVAALRAGLVWQPSLQGAAAAEEAAIRVVAAKALCDLAIVRGPKASDQWYLNREPAVRDLQVTPPSSPQQKAELKPLFDLLLDTLQLSLQAVKQDNARHKTADADEEENLASVLAEGVAKVLLHAQYWPSSSGKGLQEAEIARALAVLFVAQFDPATQANTKLRQCLSVFFPAYAAASSSHQLHIARAFRRAVRGALGVAPVKKSPAPQLMRYMLQMLQITPASKADETQGEVQQPTRQSYPGLASELVSEVALCTRFAESKSYLTACLKVLLALPLTDQDPAAIKQLRALVGQVTGLVKDRAAAKDLAALAKQLENLDATPQQSLSADELAVLLSSVNLDNTSTQAPTAPQSQEGNAIPSHSPNLGLVLDQTLHQSTADMSGQGLLADCPLPFQEAAGGGAAKTPARGRRGAGKKGVNAEDSDHESRAVLPSTAARRQMPARSARTTKKLVEAMSSSDSPSTSSSSESDDNAE